MSKQKDKVTRPLNDTACEVIVELATLLHNMGRIDGATLTGYKITAPKAKLFKSTK